MCFLGRLRRKKSQKSIENSTNDSNRYSQQTQGRTHPNDSITKNVIHTIERKQNKEKAAFKRNQSELQLSRIISQSTESVLPSYYDNQLIVLHNFIKRKNAKLLRYQLLKCEYFLVSLVLYDSKLNIFALWTVGKDKTRHLRLNFGLRQTVINIYHNFLTFY